MHPEGAKGIVRDGILSYACNGKTVTVPVDSASWQSWLETAQAFRFRDEAGSFTAQKRQASNRRGGWYWYAYRRRGGHLESLYLGTSSRLTLEHLRHAARQLAERGAVVTQRSSEPSSNQCSFLATKLHIPRLPTQHVARTRLVQALDQGLRHRLTLVSAPAGSGKTTLLAAWAQACEVPVAWLSLEAADDDPLRFLAYVVASLERLDARMSERAFATYWLTEEPSWERLLTRLINDLAQIFSNDIVLLLDDYHHITSESIHAALRFLIDHAPSQLHLVIGTRGDPPLPLARLRGQGQLQALGPELLRFSWDELQTFFQHIALDLPLEAQRLVEQQTQGWIVGVQLLSLALREQNNPVAFLQAHPGTHRFLLDYVSEEILSHQSTETREFLLMTSVLERFTASLCIAVTGQPNSAEQLRELYRSTLLHELDEEGIWHGYHPLFAESLRAHLLKQRPELVSELYRRASQWYEQQSWKEEASEYAVEYALLAGDAARAAALLADLIPYLIADGKITRLQRWLAQLAPSLIAASPQLWLASIWMQCYEGDLERIIQQFEEQIALHAEDTDSSWTNLQGELTLFKGWLALGQQDFPRTISLVHNTLYARPSPEGALSRLIAVRQSMMLSTAYRAGGNLEEAERVLLAALRTQTGEASCLLNPLAKVNLAALYEARGRLNRAGRLYLEMVRILDQHQSPSFPFLALVQAHYATLLYEWSQLAEAEAAAQQASELVQRLDMPAARLQLYCLWLQTRITQACSNRGIDACHLSEQADTLARHQSREKTPLHWETLPGLAVSARLGLAIGNIEQAERWAIARGIRFDEPPSLQAVSRDYFDYVTLARLLLARGRDDASTLNEALMLLDHLRLTLVGTGYTGWSLEIEMLIALTLHAMGKTKRALDTLGPVLTQAEPAGYIRLFADEGEPMAQLLALVAPYTTASSSYLHRLRAALSSSSIPPTIHQPLSGREREVLHLLAAGYSNQQIAQELIISLHTVKRHVQHIFTRLTVTNRMQAVRRARELQLL
jgi:LuxR family maltose regulon positive regulatory protein